MGQPDSPAWRTPSVEDVPRTLTSSEEGLSATEAEVRLGRDGANVITARSGPTALQKLLEQFLQPLVVVLIGAAALSVFLGDYVDAAVIGAVVLLNGSIGFVQEHRAEQAIAALGKTIVTEATVARDGVLLTQLGFTCLPFMNTLMHSQPFDAWWWLAISGAGLVVFAVAEMKKVLTRGPREVTAG